MKAVGFAALAAVALGATTASAALPAIAVDAPGVTCPSADAVRGALARLRAAPVAEGTPAFRLIIERAGAGARVQLSDPAGRSLLVRQLPGSATDCAQAAQAIALIVERHFRAIEWSPAGPTIGAAPAPAPPSATTSPARPTSPPPLPPAPARPGKPLPATMPGATPARSVPAPEPSAVEAPPAPASAPATATTARAPISPSSSRFDAHPLPRLAFGAGAAFWSRGSTFAVALGGRWRILADSPLEVGASVLLPPGQTSTAVGNGGTVHVDAVPVTTSIGMAVALGRLATGVHAGALWTIERGQSASIPAPATAWRTILAAGLGISAAWPTAARVRLTGALAGYRSVLGRSYAISGVPGTVLEPSPWQAVVVLGAEWVLSP